MRYTSEITFIELEEQIKKAWLSVKYDKTKYNWILGRTYNKRNPLDVGGFEQMDNFLESLQNEDNLNGDEIKSRLA